MGVKGLKLMDAGLLALAGLHFRSRTTHVAALLRAAPTHIGAILAMLRFVFSALISARVTYVGTCLANRAGQLAATSHIARCHATDISTVYVECNAVCHHFYVVFLQACTGTGIASRRAAIAGFYAGLKLITSNHHISPISEQGFNNDPIWLPLAPVCHRATVDCSIEPAHKFTRWHYAEHAVQYAAVSCSQAPP